MTRLLEIATALGPDAFVVQSIAGDEELGRLFEYRIELLAARADIVAEQLLGTNATVSLELDDGRSRRFFNGYVTRFGVQGRVSTPAFGGDAGYLYLATLSPGAWFMTRASGSRIHDRVAIGDLVHSLMDAPGLMAVENRLGPTELRDFVVQYRETDFDFASRLAEHAGLYYFFRHEDGKHAMVLVDDKSAHAAGAGVAEIGFAGPGRRAATLAAFELASQVQPGAHATGDYDPAAPNAAIAAAWPHAGGHANDGAEIFDFPAATTTAAFARIYARIRGEESSCLRAIGRGAGSDRNLQVGCRTTLANHPVPALNRDYLVTAHRFRATNNLAHSAGAASGADFLCEFECIPASTQFRPARRTPRPSVAGTQSALVVADFRTDTDASGGAGMGRVRVQFRWDRHGKPSCWARVSTPWAGKGYGFQNMPRLGEEVLVQFIEGDPDRPVVVGRVHNAENLPPFRLPASAAFTGLKTLSIDAAGRGVAGRWSELRFDDSAGREQVYLQAQRDLDTRVLRDAKTWVGGERHQCVAGDAFDRFEADHHVRTGGDHNAAVGGALSFDVGADVHFRSGGRWLVDGGREVHVKGALKVVVEAGAQVSLKCGGSFIDINPGGVFIRGPVVRVDAGGSAGAGSGAAPIAARAASEAMTSAGGRPAARPKTPAQPTTLSAKASSFKLAAATAAPFVAADCDG